MNYSDNPVEPERPLDTKPDRRDAAGMSEEEPKAASPLSTEGPAAGAGPDPVPAAPPAPVNKVHEWTAAAVIVVLLTLVLVGFVFFMRGASI